MKAPFKRLLLSGTTVALLTAASIPAWATYTVRRTNTTTYYNDPGYSRGGDQGYQEGNRSHNDGAAVAGLAIGAIAGAALIGIISDNGGFHHHHHRGWGPGWGPGHHRHPYGPGPGWGPHPGPGGGGHHGGGGGHHGGGGGHHGGGGGHHGGGGHRH